MIQHVINKNLRNICVAICVTSAVAVFTATKVEAAVIHRAPNNLGLVGYWSFNEATGTVATDFSSNKNTGTLNGANGLPTWTGGRLGSALSFDGVDDAVNLGKPIPLNNITVKTIAAWIYPYSIGNGKYRAIVESAYSTDPAGGWEFEICSNVGGDCSVSNTIEFFYKWSGSSVAWIAPAGTIKINQWQHVVVVYDNSSTSNNPILYYNGISVLATKSFGSPSGNAGDDSSINKGIGSCIDYSFGDPFNGLIDEVRVYNRALSDSEIRQLYQAGLVQINPSAQNKQLTSGLVGEWTFNGQDMNWASTTAEALDRSGNNNNGDVTNGAQIAVGQVGQALNFDGVNDYVDAGNQPSLRISGSFTVSAWANWKAFNVGGTDEGIISKSGGFVSDVAWRLRGSEDCTNEAINLQVSGNGSTLAHRCGATTLSLNTWYHVVGVYNASTQTIDVYLNGVLDNGNLSGTVPASIYNSSSDVIIGRYWLTDDCLFPGLIDEVRIYNYALSTSTIQQLYKMGAARFKPDKSLVNVMKDSSLVGHWTFNGPDVSNTADLVYDRSGNNNNGTMTNMATSTRFAIGKSGQALNFDGVDDYVSIADNASLNLTTTFTVGIWIRLARVGDTSRYKHIYSPGISPSWSFYIGNTDYYAINDSYGSNTFITDTNWHYLVVVKNGNSGTNLTYYYDGQPDGSYAIGSLAAISGTKAIGRFETEESGYFPGLIDEVRIYNRALSASEVRALYRAEGGR